MQAGRRRSPMKLCGFDVGLDRPLFLIAGPCVVESRQLQMDVAGELKEICADLGIPFIFKSSYDKANRSSAASFRGPGMDEGLRDPRRGAQARRVPVLTDVHAEDEIAAAAAVVDVLQTPAFLCRQTDFIQAVARAGKPVNIKKGQFLAPEDMKTRRRTRRARRAAPTTSWCASAAPRSATTTWSPTCARSRSCATRMPGRLRRDALGAVAGRAGHVARRPARVRAGARARRGGGGRGRRVHGDASGSRRRRSPTGPMRGRSIGCARCSRR